MSTKQCGAITHQFAVGGDPLTMREEVKLALPADHRAGVIWYRWSSASRVKSTTVMVGSGRRIVARPAREITDGDILKPATATMSP
jgi:hypothetical protein